MFCKVSLSLQKGRVRRINLVCRGASASPPRGTWKNVWCQKLPRGSKMLCPAEHFDTGAEITALVPDEGPSRTYAMVQFQPGQDFRPTTWHHGGTSTSSKARLTLIWRRVHPLSWRLHPRWARRVHYVSNHLRRAQSSWSQPLLLSRGGRQGWGREPHPYRIHHLARENRSRCAFFMLQTRSAWRWPHRSLDGMMSDRNQMAAHVSC